MDKAKSNFVIVMVALVIVCVALAGYAANLNSQLGAEKTKTMQLNDQIAGLSLKAKNLETQIVGITTQSNNQASIAGGLQRSIDAAKMEIDNLKAANAELESKLKAELDKAAAKVQQVVTTEAIATPVPALVPAKAK